MAELNSIQCTPMALPQTHLLYTILNMVRLQLLRFEGGNLLNTTSLIDPSIHAN
jgi:hypothetical protein